MKKRFLILLLLCSVLCSAMLVPACSKPAVGSQTQLKAAIIDQLGNLYPNEQFIQDVSKNLQRVGFTVTIFKGDQININLFQNLPSYGFKLIIFRVHSGLLQYDKQPLKKTYLFTNELYARNKYVLEQLSDLVLPARANDNSPDYFAVSSNFISKSSQGLYNQSVIIMMGCTSLHTPDLAKAFVDRGALIYAGWTTSVKLDLVDNFTTNLIKNLCIKGASFKEAAYYTAYGKGADPTNEAIFSYYPIENENICLLGSN